MNKTSKLSLLFLTLGAFLISCGGERSKLIETTLCSETGPYACKSGETEPLYIYQWALKATQSFFASYSQVSDGVTDLNIEALHLAGIKGQGVNVLVLDDGIEINHIDLKDNINRSTTWNFQNNTSDPTPSNKDDAHGTNVAGIIAAVQNGIGVMGIAPRVSLGGARFIGLTGNVIPDPVQAYGGAPWSKNADVFNASYGATALTPPNYNQTSASNAALQNFPNLRNGKGAIMIKSSGNEYNYLYDKGIVFNCPKFNYNSVMYEVVSCANPSEDIQHLELPVIVTAAVNAKGTKSSYSSAGSLVWVSGLGGEQASIGKYGEGGNVNSNQGPQIYSTDLMGCDRGYSTNDTSLTPEFIVGGSSINKEKNPNCDFDQMNGTSSAAPTVTGVVALMLSVNPNLGWRDIRDILRKTALPIDANYGDLGKRNYEINLTLNPTVSGSTSTALIDGSTSARIDYGWQTNKAGNKYSNWYGFGLVNAKAAIDLARTYTTYKSTTLIIPTWTLAFSGGTVEYGKVRELGKFTIPNEGSIDMIQLKLSATTTTNSVCMGSVGIFLKSPHGTVSALSTPYNIFYDKTSDPNDSRDGGKLTDQSNYVLGSYSFYGEDQKGEWTVYAISGTPLTTSNCAITPKLDVAYRIYKAE